MKPLESLSNRISAALAERRVTYAGAPFDPQTERYEIVHLPDWPSNFTNMSQLIEHGMFDWGLVDLSGDLGWATSVAIGTYLSGRHKEKGRAIAVIDRATGDVLSLMNPTRETDYVRGIRMGIQHALPSKESKEVKDVPGDRRAFNVIGKMGHGVEVATVDEALRLAMLDIHVTPEAFERHKAELESGRSTTIEYGFSSVVIECRSIAHKAESQTEHADSAPAARPRM